MQINYNNINNNNNNGNGNGNHNVSNCNSIGGISNYICDKCKDNGNKHYATHAYNHGSNCEYNNNKNNNSGISIGALRDCRSMPNNYERSICGQNCSCNNNSNTATSDNFNCGNNGTRQTPAICSSAAASVGNLRAAINVRDNNRIRYYGHRAVRGSREDSRKAAPNAPMRQLQLLLPLSALPSARSDFALFHA